MKNLSTLTIEHDNLALAGWPVGTRLVIDSSGEPEPYDIVEFQADDIRDVGIYRPSPCGRCASFVGARVYEPRKWEVLGVALHALAE